MVKKLGINYDVRKERRYYVYFGILLVLIGLVLVGALKWLL
jgi:hypothetical protein